MLTLSEWYGRARVASRPWLVLGKGPSFSRWRDYAREGYFTLSLNHAVRELPVTAAHIIDWDVVTACREAIDRQAQYLLLPWRPHVGNRPGPQTLPALIGRHPFLQQWDREGRLVGYWLSSAGAPAPAGEPLIAVKYFSSEAALRILAQGGVKTIRSLGVDGGTTYSGAFEDLAGSTLLRNGRRSFDDQFQEIAAFLHATGVDYAPLHAESPVRVYVGTTASQELPCQVLAHSIRRHATMSVEVHPMRDLPVPQPARRECRPRTPFSFSRFLIPRLAGFRGKAIYLDADMLVFQDIARLWQTPMEGARVLYVEQPRAGRRPRQFSVLLMDCARLPWDIEQIVRDLDAGRYAYEDLMYRFCLVPDTALVGRLPPAWNSLERYVPGRTALLHYTDMPRQPWVSARNRWGHLWMAELAAALEDGCIPWATVEAEVRQGHVRPSLVRQLQRRRPWPRWYWAFRDRHFQPPYLALAG